MIEVLPFLYYAYYEEEKSEKFFKRNKIKCILHISSQQRGFSKDSGFEEVSIALEKNIDRDGEHKVNIEFYGYIYDLVEFIYNKVIIENINVCILGHQNKQDIDALLMAYLIRFANVNYQEAHHYVLSKKLDNHYERSYYYMALKKYAQQIELTKKLDY
jgi:hypothetical protein